MHISDQFNTLVSNPTSTATSTSTSLSRRASNPNSGTPYATPLLNRTAQLKHTQLKQILASNPLLLQYALANAPLGNKILQQKIGPISFSNDINFNSDQLIFYNWHASEAGHRWSKGKSSIILFKMPIDAIKSPAHLSLDLKASTFGQQHIIVK